MSDYARGLLITALGVLVLTPDSLLIRMMATDIWSVLAWRCGLAGLICVAVVILWYGMDCISQFRNIGWAGASVIACYGIGNVGFAGGVMMTEVADVLVIIAATPMTAAFWSWALYGERTRTRTWIAIVVCMIGVLITVNGSFGRGNAVGALLALMCVATLGLAFTLLRYHPRLNPVLVAGLGYLIGAAIGLVLAGDLVLTGQPLMAGLIAGLLVAPLAISLVTYGTRYLPSPEVGLLMLGETIFGPLWIWYFLAEEPAPEAWLGGALILSTLVIHTLVALRENRMRRRLAPASDLAVPPAANTPV